MVTGGSAFLEATNPLLLMKGSDLGIYVFFHHDLGQDTTKQAKHPYYHDVYTPQNPHVSVSFQAKGTATIRGYSAQISSEASVVSVPKANNCSRSKMSNAFSASPLSQKLWNILSRRWADGPQKNMIVLHTPEIYLAETQTLVGL